MIRKYVYIVNKRFEYDWYWKGKSKNQSFFMNIEGLLCDWEQGEKPLYSCTRSREWFLVSLMISFL